MSVKIARLRNGEDVISDIREVHSSPEPEDASVPIAWQLNYPYSIQVLSIQADDGVGKIQKISEPELFFQPWAPLASKSDIMLRLEEVVSLYDPHDAVMEKYQEIMEAQQDGQRESSSTEERESE
jgi:hypothetical protein